MKIILMTAASFPGSNKITLLLLLPWGILGLPKALGLYGCFEDAILFGAGLYGTIMLIVNWKGKPYYRETRTADITE